MSVLAKTKHPCRGVCSTTTGDLICRGCHRSVEQIRDWNGYTEAQKVKFFEGIKKTRRSEPISARN